MVYYNTPARLMSSHACREILRRFAKSVNVYEDIPAVMHLQVQQAFIEFSGPRTRHKPRLVLQGKPLKFIGNFPDQISECRLVRESDQQLVSYNYELTRYNLSDLCKKGLFEPGFQVPNIIRHNTMELPCCCDLVTVRSDEDEGLDGPDPMLVFIRVRDGSREKEQNSLVCFDTDRVIDGREVPGSGYVISDYFEAMPDTGYVMSEEPEAMDDLESEYIGMSPRTLKQPDKQEMPEVSHDDYLFDDVPDLESDDRTDDDLPDDIPDELQGDPEAAALFERVRREANAAYEQRERQKREQAAAQAAAVQSEYEQSDDEAEQEDGEAKQDADRHNPLKLDHVRDVNKAANIDTTREYLEEKDSVDAGDLSQVDFKLDDLKKDDPSRRKLPDVSGIEAPDTDTEYIKE